MVASGFRVRCILFRSALDHSRIRGGLVADRKPAIDLSDDRNGCSRDLPKPCLVANRSSGHESLAGYQRRSIRDLGVRTEKRGIDFGLRAFDSLHSKPAKIELS